ncbi:hypothetical protein [Psychroserpens mesophilus]|uniref:hypothetical protein n=1 Tax=Psychroserpens mesophilus TaxID=325473 RepID=UPI003D653D07
MSVQKLSSTLLKKIDDNPESVMHQFDLVYVKSDQLSIERKKFGKTMEFDRLESESERKKYFKRV